tara:strand:- start:10328 stop:11329 length:1002 start_codon:yes stop_codon:yes gene_type:complete
MAETAYQHWINSLLDSLEWKLNTYALSYEKPKALAEQIKRLSDFYIHKPREHSPWDEDFCKIAYLAYYHPLNAIRYYALMDYISAYSFPKIVELGSGLGAFSAAFSQFAEADFHFVERAEVARDLHKSLSGERAHWSAELRQDHLSGALLALTFSHTENIAIQRWLPHCEHVLVVDPATKEDFGHLSHLRQKLIDSGFEILAPCTHHQTCPMAESKKDWCHFSARYSVPQKLRLMEQYLPWQHHEPAFSFVLASKTYKRKVPKGYGRLIGNPLKEKGKFRQLYCNGSERVFLTALKKQVSEWPFRRGECLRIHSHERKASELRIRSLDNVDKY